MNADVAESIGIALLTFTLAMVLWLWRKREWSPVTRMALASFLILGYGLCKSFLREKYPDAHQDPAGQGLGAAYPLIFWTAVSAVLALSSAGLVIARGPRLSRATTFLGLAPLVLFVIVFLLLCAGVL